MRLKRRELSRSAVSASTIVLVHALWLASGLPGRRVLSDLLFVVGPLGGAITAVVAARRLHGRARLCWSAFAATQFSWTAANLVWGWYELVRHEVVPSTSVLDVFYLGAYACGLTGVIVALLTVVPNRAGAWRVACDVLISGGGLVLIAWVVVFGWTSGDGGTVASAGLTWLYPAFDVAVGSLAFAVLTHVPARARAPWLCIGVGSLAGAVANTLWASANLDGGFLSGSLVDVIWVASYAVFGMAGVGVTGDAGLERPRLAPSRWEIGLPYVPLLALGGVFFWAEGHGGVTATMRLGGVVVGVGILVRQLLVTIDNARLTRTLEARVEERTAELRDREAHFRSIVTSISDVVFVIDDGGCISYHTPVVRPLGYEGDELVGTRVVDLMHPDDLAALRQRPGPLDAIGTVFLNRFLHRDGTWRYLESRVTELIDHPDLHGMLVVLRDVGDRVELEERLRHQAYHDALTGLANRSLLHEELEAAIGRGERPSLLVLDLDGFKAVNDTAGHDLGDEVLVAVARRLRHATRPRDVVARLGGDEFAVLVPDDPEATAALAVAGRVLHALRLPLMVKQRSIRCLGSVGVASATADASAAGLLRDADVAMYVAKARGKGRSERFTPAMRDELLRRQELEDLVRRAVADRRLVLHYQPVLSLASGEVVGAEALVRLRGDDGNLISPVEFVPIAEDLGLIGEIGLRVLAEACRTAAGWQQLDGGRAVSIAVNVSTLQLQGPELIRQVSSALEVSGLAPELLTLEITEGALTAEPVVEETLRSLRALGVRLSIDDFGAGYSSLGRLRSFPVDELKIDRSFVAELTADGEATLVEAILAMAASLGLDVVAEGIESGEQAEALRARGCCRGQGFLFSPPVPADELAAWLVRGRHPELAART
jgi:diguanylate cyclase (GGDEF)-like protein/PAS domain S-box-containing protein